MGHGFTMGHDETNRAEKPIAPGSSPACSKYDISILFQSPVHKLKAQFGVQLEPITIEDQDQDHDQTGKNKNIRSLSFKDPIPLNEGGGAKIKR